MRPTNKTAKATSLLIFGCCFAAVLLSTCFMYIENHVARINWTVPNNGTSAATTTTNNNNNNVHQLKPNRRRLAEAPPPPAAKPAAPKESAPTPPPLSEAELQQKQMRSYLGGLYPPVDKSMLPLYLRDVTDETNMQILDMYHPSGQAVARNRDLVFFWHIPKASGSTMKNIMKTCFDLRRAEQTEKKPSMEYARENILNMDTSSPDGLALSFANRLVDSNKIDVMVSNYFLSGSALFTDIHYGKTFTIMRHPVDIALSLFHYRRKAHWERSHRKDWMKLSFHEYVTMESYMDGWMVRQLTGTMPWVTLDESHLERAKLILQKKIFVGIMSEMDETLRQFKDHFGWEEKTPACVHNLLHDKPNNENAHPGLQGGRGGKTWNVLAEKEKWDMSLYHYALELFGKQRVRYPPKAKVQAEEQPAAEAAAQ